MKKIEQKSKKRKYEYTYTDMHTSTCQELIRHNTFNDNFLLNFSKNTAFLIICISSVHHDI